METDSLKQTLFTHINTPKPNTPTSEQNRTKEEPPIFSFPQKSEKSDWDYFEILYTTIGASFMHIERVVLTEILQNRKPLLPEQDQTTEEVCLLYFAQETRNLIEILSKVLYIRIGSSINGTSHELQYCTTECLELNPSSDYHQSLLEDLKATSETVSLHDIKKLKNKRTSSLSYLHRALRCGSLSHSY